LSSSALSLLLVPVLLLTLVLAFLTHLVRKAQREINHRTAMAAYLQMRLEKFVSRRAANAALTSQNGLNAGRSVDVCLYFSDVRSFTSYAEKNSPTQVVYLLNTLIDIQVKALYKFGGDVDKIIGDAVLAVFSGENRSARAIACAQEILQHCNGRPDIARHLGIGIHDGPVIVGSIGSPDRLDYTVIGDSVNVAARFSEIARSGEIVADISTIATARFPVGFSPMEKVTLKGRISTLQIKRWSI
jgi:adenylate cyclase